MAPTLTKAKFVPMEGDTAASGEVVRYLGQVGRTPCAEDIPRFPAEPPIPFLLQYCGRIPLAPYVVVSPTLESQIVSVGTALASGQTAIWYAEPTACLVGPPEKGAQPEGPESVYSHRDDLDVLLGDAGTRVLERVIALISGVAEDRGWPLSRIEVDLATDPELEGWRYVLIVLSFGCTFEKADAYLRQLYADLDRFGSRLDTRHRDVLERLLFFDVAASAV